MNLNLNLQEMNPDLDPSLLDRLAAASPLDEFEEILRGSGRNEVNRIALRVIRAELPEREWLAVSSWVSTFFGYQQNWLLDPSKDALLLKSRQSGGSHTYAAVAVLWSILNKQDTIIISKTERDAVELLTGKIAVHISVLVKLGSLRAVTVQSSMERIVFSNGSRIISLAPAGKGGKGSGGRGYTGNLILDEFAYYAHPEEQWDASSAVTTHGGRRRILSTPNGVGNQFYVVFKERKELDYRLHRVTIHQAIADGMVNLDPKMLLLSECQNDIRKFGQIYECKFLDSEYQFFPFDLLESARKDDYGDGFTGAYVAGLDIGRRVDLTVLTVLQKHGTERKWCLRWIEKTRRTSLSDLERMVGDAKKRFNFRKLSVDATGIGDMPVEELQKKFGHSKIDAITFTPDMKAEMATATFQVLSRDQLWLPSKKMRQAGCEPDECDLLIQDMASIQRISTDAGGVKYDAPHTKHGHADRAWSLCLAVLSAMNAPTYARLQ